MIDCKQMLIIKTVLTIFMVLHVMIFKSEISNNFDLEKFSISKVKKFVKEIPTLAVDIMELIHDYNIDTYKYINDKLTNDIFNPVKLLSEVMVFQDDTESCENQPEGCDEAGSLNFFNKWIVFFKNNWMMMLIIIVTVFWVILPALAIVLASGILAIPKLIFYTVLIYIIAICLGLLYLIFFRDNSSEIMNCAEGLDASGNIKDTETMSNKDKLKMKMCKYWLESVEPVTLIFSSLKKSKDIKIVNVIKDGTGKAIKVILPGNVIYGVKSRDTLIEDESTSELRTIYLDPEKIDLLKNNMALFKDLKNEMYNPKDVFKTFMDDYKTNMMTYFGINNINMFFFYTFAILFTLSFTDTIRNLMYIKNTTISNHIVVDSGRNYVFMILILIIKVMTIGTPLKHVIKNFFHLDLVKDKIFGDQAKFLLFEVIIYLMSGFFIIMLAVTNNSEIISCFGPMASKTWLLILWFLACSIKILFGDIIICEVDGTYDKGNICEKSIYTDLQRIQECDKLSKVIETEEFTNISNKKSMKNLLGYSSIRERFSVPTNIETQIVDDIVSGVEDVKNTIPKNKNIIKQMKNYNCKLENKVTSFNDKIKFYLKSVEDDLKEIYTKTPSKVTMMKFIKSVDWIIFMSVPFYILLSGLPTMSVKTMSFFPTINGDVLPFMKQMISYFKIAFIWVLTSLVTVLVASESDNIELIIMVMLPYVLLVGCEVLVLPLK